MVAACLTVLALVSSSGCAREQAAQPSPILKTTESKLVEEVPGRARGMWVWSTKTRLNKADGVSSLLSTCALAKINELYLSVGSGVLDDPLLPGLMSQLAAAGIRVEALMGEADWYLPERRPEMGALIANVGVFNARGGARFAAIHLDVEPHQLPANRADHAFLLPLAVTMREARTQAATLGMALSADLPRFAFEEQGPLFAKAVARPFVMLYELRDRRSPWLVQASRAVIDDGYRDAIPELRGKVVVGLRVEDYPSDLDSMFTALDGAHGTVERYGGWAIHDEAKYRARLMRLEGARSDTASCP
jgi:hypothetical protein